MFDSKGFVFFSADSYFEKLTVKGDAFRTIN